MSDVSKSLRLLINNERCERIAQVAYQKWTTMSDSLRSLTKNERPWANCPGCSLRMSESLVFELIAHSLIFSQKTSDSLRKLMSEFPVRRFVRRMFCLRGGRSNCNTVINIIKWNTRPGGLQKREKKTKDRDIWELQKYDLHIVLSKFNTAVNKKNSYSKSEKLLGTIMCFCILSHHDPKHQFVNFAQTTVLFKLLGLQIWILSNQNISPNPDSNVHSFWQLKILKLYNLPWHQNIIWRIVSYNISWRAML